MNDFISYFIICFLSVCGYIYIEGMNNEVSYVKSSIDGEEYLVRNLDDSVDAANLMAVVRERLDKLSEHLKKKYPNDKRTTRLLQKFNPNNITEASKNNKYTSYSVNKGEKIVLCLRSRDSSETLIDINTLMFVTLHELSHIITVSIGHTDEFWNNFKFILNISSDIGICTNVDYSKYPKKYCGITITDSPVYN
tara:strand:- start:157 stop:738 length:582 start_codon:yes stop_codon:yes gene_type:complete